MQIGFSLKCINGDDEGLEARFAATSTGGKRAVQELAVAIAEQVDKDPAAPVPVVELLNDSYKHKTYGKVFAPIFEVRRWIGMDGEGDAPAAAPAAKAAPAKRAPVAAAAAPAPAADVADPPADDGAAEAAFAAADEAPRRRRRVVS
jgi:hypothetical protein